MALSHRLVGFVDLLKFFYAQRVVGFEVPDEPHFDPQSTGPFVDLLGKAKCYLEFGSGGSTVVAAKLGIDTITVESDRFFAKSVKTKIGKSAKNKMLSVNIGITRAWGFPIFTKQTPARLKRWSEYVLSPFRYLDEHRGPFPDLVLVDGRFRKACALVTAQQALARGASTVICVDDYAGRDDYHDMEADLGAPEMIGRMAIFRVRPGQPAPSSAALERAMRDVR